MNLGALKADVSRILQDPTGTTWSSNTIVLHLKRAIQRPGQILGDSARITLSLVQSQQEYPLPLGQQRRITKLRLLPELVGTIQGEPGSQGLTQVPLDQVPIITQQERDPEIFAVQTTGGTNFDQFSIFLWPAPARSATDAIIIDTEVDYSDSFTADGDPIPFPPAWDLAIIYLTCASLLSERDDANDIAKGEVFQKLAERQIADLAPVNATSFHRDVNRAFP